MYESSFFSWIQDLRALECKPQMGFKSDGYNSIRILQNECSNSINKTYIN